MGEIKTPDIEREVDSHPKSPKVTKQKNTQLNVETIKIKDLKPYEKNAKLHPASQIAKIRDSILTFGYNDPIAISETNEIIEGHGRLEALKQINSDPEREIKVIRLTGMTQDQIKAYRIAHNKINMITEFDLEILKEEFHELEDTEFFHDTGFDSSEITEIWDEKQEVVEDKVEVDAYERAKNKTKIKLGEIYQLGEHRLMCGDSTNETDVTRLMHNQKADMVFTDPPYGMKKENEGILNDNLNYVDLLEFNKKWIKLSFEYLKEDNSWYCWGTPEPLMDIYSVILKPLIRENKVTFRNLITWDKGNGQGQLAEEFRMYPIADEKCLFVMTGVQGFNTNSDNYWEGWEPLRTYLEAERKKAGWDIPTMKRIAGHSDIFRDHWTGKSQWNFLTEEVYLKLQEGSNGDCFKRSYSELKEEYNLLKQEFDVVKQEFYSTRAYFNNTHDNMNNVWHFKRDIKNPHATPKPIELCARAINSSSRKEELILDLFGGSGSTLITCEQLSRTCFMMELDPIYCQIIIDRWEKLTGKEAIKA